VAEVKTMDCSCREGVPF